MKFEYVFIIITLFYSCTEEVEVLVTKEEKEIREKEIRESKEKELLKYYDVIVLDGCEYYSKGTSGAAVFSHKGNCSNPIHKCNCK